jgi:hypothetical protein
VQSRPSNYVYPLATRQALNRSMVPSVWYLSLYTHLLPMARLPTGKGHNVQVLFCARAVNSVCMASCHRGSEAACANDVGSLNENMTN